MGGGLWLVLVLVSVSGSGLGLATKLSRGLWVGGWVGVTHAGCTILLYLLSEEM